MRWIDVLFISASVGAFADELPRNWLVADEVDQISSSYSSPIELPDGRVVVIDRGMVSFYDRRQPSGRRVQSIRIVRGGLPRSVGEGEKQPQRESSESVHYSTPLVLSNGRLAMTSPSGEIYVFNPAGDVSSIRLEPIARRGGELSPFHSSPIRIGDRAVAIDLDGQVWDIVSGRRLLRLPNEGGSVEATPVVLDSNRLLVPKSDGHIYIVNLQTQEMTKIADFDSLRALTNGRADAWPRAIFSSPARLQNGTIVVAAHHPSNDRVGRLFFFSADGTPQRTTFDAGGSVIASPLVLRNGNFVIVTANGKVHFLRPDGSVIRSHDRMRTGRSSPIQLADGKILLARARGFSLFSEEGELIGNYEVRGTGTPTPLQMSNGQIALVSQGGFSLLATDMNSHHAPSASFTAPRMLHPLRNEKQRTLGVGTVL